MVVLTTLKAIVLSNNIQENPFETGDSLAKKKIANRQNANQRFFKRSLADSNRCTRFCRPVTKPLIQATFCV